jgi:hypothetical protein
MKEIELDIAAVEIRSGMDEMLDAAINEARELRNSGATFPSGTVGALFLDLLSAADKGTPREELKKMHLNILDNVARAMLDSKGISHE